jgi:hypothetical protein
MSPVASAIYVGHVAHKRLHPKPHALKYGVFSLLLDLDEHDRLSARLRLFSRNRFNVFSFHDADHGDGGPDAAAAARQRLAAHGLAEAGHRILLLCYPRVLGYVFNPLSVYFCHDAGGALRALIYEVDNTFGGRTHYVCPAAGQAREGLLFQHARKDLHVSPFNAAHGEYTFHIRPPSDDVTVGVALRQDGRPILKAHFTGARLPLDDRRLLRLAATYPLMTLKVIAGIHWEAAKLWAKGIPVAPRPARPEPARPILDPLRDPPAP